MLDDREQPSLHGKLIGCVLEYWGNKSIFEQNDQTIRNNLLEALESKLNFKTQITWNDSPELIDRQMISGNVLYLDENDTARSIAFIVSPAGAKAKEYEEN